MDGITSLFTAKASEVNILARTWRRQRRQHDVGGAGHARRLRGLCQADTGDGRRWRSRRDGDNDDDIEEGGLHPTPLTMVTLELMARLRSAGIPYVGCG